MGPEILSVINPSHIKLSRRRPASKEILCSTGGYYEEDSSVVCSIGDTVASWAQSDARLEILVCGTYHMSNPGHDVHNMRADDVLCKQVGQEYSDYLPGKYTPSPNEIDQIGYRVTKELGHQAVYPVDEDGDFPRR